MFHPLDHPLERGWVGRVDGAHVVQLAAQTLQSFFTGGGTAREHAVYPLDSVRLLAPVLHPPAIRVFDAEDAFEFANPAAVVGPEAVVEPRSALELVPRTAAVVGVDGAIGGYTVCADWRSPQARPPKDRDFALGLGPVVVTPDERPAASGEAVVRLDGAERLRRPLPPFDWDAARTLALDETTLYPGDILAGPPWGRVEGLWPGAVVEIELGWVGVLRQCVEAPV
jgi:hypothetical protein